MDCSLPGSSVHGIFQARVLEWGAIAFSFKMARALQMKTTIPLKAVNSILLLRAQEVTTPYLISYGLGLLTVWLQVSILSLMAHYIRIFINSTFKKTNPSQISLFHVCICFCWDLTDCKQWWWWWWWRRRAVIETQFSSVTQSCPTPLTAARQPSLSITNSRSLPKLTSIESVMQSNHLFPCRPLLLPPSIFPNIRVFSNESALRIRWPKYWSFSFKMNTQDWSPLGWTGWISLQSKGFSRVFSNTIVQKHQFFNAQLSL